MRGKPSNRIRQKVFLCCPRFNGSKQLILKAITSCFLYIQSKAKFVLDIV